LRGAKGLPQKVRQTAKIVCERLRTASHSGEKLGGSLGFLYSYHFKISGKDYRVAYEIKKNTKTIVVYLIQSRESFYDKLRRMFK